MTRLDCCIYSITSRHVGRHIYQIAVNQHTNVHKIQQCTEDTDLSLLLLKVVGVFNDFTPMTLYFILEARVITVLLCQNSLPLSHHHTQ